ncbi:60S acidic ribosomal protein P1 [Trachymyrmex septentrionalis]|uniref:Large ribosomal subunit protein P1 n=1 Tax=Trachymyrmex septentrionalis TaxID=34720 RepID=A0A195FVY1_9HYME|nr:60S acidic ribosomal protein P1 [Trachymyrmex septentrionalis]
MTTEAELACVYSALILVDDDIAVTGEKIQTILKAANVNVESYWPGLFAKALEGINVKELITNIGSGVGAAPVGAAPAAAAPVSTEAAPAKEEKKKEEPEEESDDDMGFVKSTKQLLKKNPYVVSTKANEDNITVALDNNEHK